MAEIGGMNKYPVTLISQGFEITIALPYYWDFMDSGVSGAKKNTGISKYKFKDKGKGKNGKGQRGVPNIKAIRLFMINRGIVGKNYTKIRDMPRSEKRQRAIDEELNRVAYAIAYKIWRDGLLPTNWVSDVLNDNLLRRFEEQILNEYGRLIIEINKLK